MYQCKRYYNNATIYQCNLKAIWNIKLNVLNTNESTNDKNGSQSNIEITTTDAKQQHTTTTHTNSPQNRTIASVSGNSTQTITKRAVHTHTN